MRALRTKPSPTIVEKKEQPQVEEEFEDSIEEQPKKEELVKEPVVEKPALTPFQFNE